jgi:hypothetical protein
MHSIRSHRWASSALPTARNSPAVLKRLGLLAFAFIVLPLSGDDPAWMEKPIPQWDDQDAKQVLADSPWVKSVKLEKVRDLSVFARRDGGDWDAGIAPGGGLAGAGLAALLGVLDPQSEALAIELSRRLQSELGSVAVRWESALPVRAAEQKEGELGSPMWDGNYYAIAVYDVHPPFHWNLANELKDVAFLKRDKKKDVKPARVQILPRDNGLITVVYLFPRSAEITRKDPNIRFVAQIGRLFVSQFFFPEDMQFLGKPEL